MPARRPSRQPPFDPPPATPARTGATPREPERSARPFVPASLSLPSMRSAAMMLVGEQPGDKEDIEGTPFIGPAGALLHRALEEAGVDLAATYVTNAVKHFSWEPRGKRRIHKKPRASEIRACRPWLDAEIESVRPHVIVCLGATAAQALLGSDFKLMAR